MRAICLLEMPSSHNTKLSVGQILETDPKALAFPHNTIYLGLFEGADLPDIRQHAADTTHIPRDKITVVEIKERTSTVPQNVHPGALSHKHWLNRTVWNNKRNKKGVATFVSMRTNSHNVNHKCLIVEWDDSTISKPLIENVEEDPNGNLHLTK